MQIRIDKIVAVLSDGTETELRTKISQDAQGLRIVVTPNTDMRIREFVLYRGKHGFAPNARFYGDGYSKLSQYGGRLNRIRNIGSYADRTHYRMPCCKGFHTCYNYIWINDDSGHALIGATSCYRFRTELRVAVHDMQIVQCAENVRFAKGEEIELERMFIGQGQEKAPLFDTFADMLENNHPRKVTAAYPTGWCSWYCIGSDVTESKILENLEAIRRKTPQLQYIQIDDGYQPHMGDWLDVGDRFGKSMQEVCAEIKSKGFEPAVWVAPFIASANSRLLQEHPDYFVRDESGQPLCSDRVTFAGWREAPWYFVDGTSDGAIAYIKQVFHTMYYEWGVKYFKLDANMWGALPFGKRAQNATSVEAYRRAMAAIWEAVGNDAYILGCNAPMWPSLGLVSAMRVTGDIIRNTRWQNKLLGECFNRNWMHDRLWINDPDCLVMKPDTVNVMDAGGKRRITISSKKFYKMNAVYVRASGGVVLSGDYVQQYSPDDVARLKRMLDCPRIAATFDTACEIGRIDYDNATEYCLFNRNRWRSKTVWLSVKDAKVTDMYDGKTIDCRSDMYRVKLRPYDAAWIRVEHHRQANQ